jgi:hypothetical protein
LRNVERAGKTKKKARAEDDQTKRLRKELVDQETSTTWDEDQNLLELHLDLLFYSLNVITNFTNEYKTMR